MPRRLAERLIHWSRLLFDDPVRGLQLSLLALLLVVIVGTLFYHHYEGMALVDALYMTIITVSTVGFGETEPLSATGRLFTGGLILVGVGVAASVIGNSITILTAPHLWAGIRRRKMERYLMQIEQHYIVCGYGRMGRQVVSDLQTRDEKYVVVDLSLDEELMLEQGINYVIGDATQDETLLQAGVERARGLVSALNNDAANVMTVLTARELNPDLFIVARVSDDTAESKLRRAGANRVVSPYQIGGHRLALALTRPTVDDFLRRIYDFSDKFEVDLGQIFISDKSHLAGQTVGTCRLRDTHNISILAIHRPSGEALSMPSPDTPIETGATLILLGPADKIQELEQSEASDTPPPVPKEPVPSTEKPI